jgi:hypothetical protein
MSWDGSDSDAEQRSPAATAHRGRTRGDALKRRHPATSPPGRRCAGRPCAPSRPPWGATAARSARDRADATRPPELSDGRGASEPTPPPSKQAVDRSAGSPRHPPTAPDGSPILRDRPTVLALLGGKPLGCGPGSRADSRRRGPTTSGGSRTRHSTRRSRACGRDPTSAAWSCSGRPSSTPLAARDLPQGVGVCVRVGAEPGDLGRLLRRGGGEWPLVVEADFGAAREAQATVLDPATYTSLVRAAAEMRRVRAGTSTTATAARPDRRTSRCASGYGYRRSDRLAHFGQRRR